jgi:hypothetical protein
VEHNRILVRVVGRATLVLRPEHTKHQVAHAKHISCAGRRNDDATFARGAERAASIVRGCSERGIEHAINAQRAQHLLGATDVIALRVGQHESR